MFKKQYLFFFVFLLFMGCKNTKKITKNTESKAFRLIEIAKTYQGVPYKYGGNDAHGIDCSGLMCLLFQEVGVKLPRMAWQQAAYFPEIKKEELKTGDLLFFVTNTKGKEINTISHVGIVSNVDDKNNIWFIHASTSKGVIEDSFAKSYWQTAFVKACRPFI